MAPILFPYAGKLTGGHFLAEDGKILMAVSMALPATLSIGSSVRQQTS